MAAEDVARASRAVIASDGREGQNYALAGPEAFDLYQVAEAFSGALGRRIHDYDLSEAEFAKLMLEHAGGMTAEQLEIGVLCHLRAWRDGRADLVTGTYASLTGDPPTGFDDWIGDHVDWFDARPGMGDRMAAFFLRQKHGRHRGDAGKAGDRTAQAGH